ncbi:MAG: sorbosone dehydrogenase [Caulobacter vibrioides]|uniref:Sorbosone dehydrogenase n=1 Tax=Caulobacter vibrioides TaxID=155892 RepID=A0A258CQU8_CAUVI|nr:MAG: sorbosone dehydrogenase [Caulobacter vibrioides]
MRRQVREILIIGVAACALAACGQSPGAPNTTVGYGPNPALPEPSRSLLPTVKISKVVGWSKDAKPRAPAGFEVQPFATGLDHPRWLLALPNGDVLVAESNKPARQDKPKGLRAFAEATLMKKAGAGVPSADRISLLRDQDGDGIADLKTPFLVNLYSPFGMALVGNTLYVANADAIVAFPYTEGATTISAGPRKVADLPGGPINHHWTKNIIASPDGTKLYAAVGSNSNVGENGMDNEVDRAAILEVDLATGQKRVFASGLRNPVGLSWNPANGQLWTAVNERDELGNDLVPDYMTSVRDGGFYGWPYSYFGQRVDKRVKDNRNPQAGYKVIFVPFSGGKPAGGVEDFLTGFLDSEGKAQGRPVGVTVDTTGALLVADDVGNVVWRVSAGG